MTIVVGYSADPFGRAALEHGIAEAKLRGTTLRVDQLDAGRRLRRRRVRAGGRGRTTSRSGSRTAESNYELTQPVGVDTADELLKAMDRDDAELLVIGIRHRNPVGKLLLGSVSQQLLLECPKPVLAVKPND